jgi:uncharacterized membrane protein
MKQRTRRRGSPGLELWTQGVWPILAGAVAAVGIIGASRVYGVVGMLAIYCGLSLFVVAMVWGLMASAGMYHRRVVRLGYVAATIVMVLVGLQHVLIGYGSLVALAAGLTSPPALALVKRPGVGVRVIEPPHPHAAPWWIRPCWIAGSRTS